MIKNLLERCAKAKTPAGVTVKEAYIPFFPSRWNGVLILAEAQNHGVTSASYLAWLRKLKPKQRMSRLSVWHKQNATIGIQPWDDGTLKAASAALNFNAAQIAVSNSVLWSSVKENNTNQNPQKPAIDASKKIWARFMPIMKPRLVITVGAVARELVYSLELKTKHLVLRLPSATSLSRLSGLFSTADLLSRYPNVADVCARHPEWFELYRANKILFACHATSISSELVLPSA